MDIAVGRADDAETLIFINYRSTDSANAAAFLHAELSDRFGAESVFLDYESLPLGRDFMPILLDRVRRCAVLVVVVGVGWLDGKIGRRPIDNPDDWVRREMLEALDNDIPVVPVLIGNAEMTSSRLPAELATLANRQRFEVRDRHQRSDIRNLGDYLAKQVPRLREVAEFAQPSRPVAQQMVSGKQMAGILAVVVVVLVAGFLLAVYGLDRPWSTGTDTASTDPADATTPTTPTTTTTTTVDETTTTTTVEPVSILGTVPSSIASTCEPYTESQETLTDGLVNQLTCTTPDGLTVRYLQYTDAASMETAFELHHGGIADETCAEGSALGTYSINEISRGEWACYASTSGTSVMMWTDLRYPVLGLLRDSTLSVQSVSDWFFDNPVVLDE
jgi:hypothetical protein